MDESGTIRCDLDDCDADFIKDAFETFIEDAWKYRRRVVEIRMRPAMLDHLELEEENRTSFMGVPILITDTGSDGTIEVQFAVVQ